MCRAAMKPSTTSGVMTCEKCGAILLYNDKSKALHAKVMEFQYPHVEPIGNKED